MGARALRPVLCCVLLAAGASAAQTDATPASALGRGALYAPDTRTAQDTAERLRTGATDLAAAPTAGATDTIAAPDAPAAPTVNATDTGAAPDLLATPAASAADTTARPDAPVAPAASALTPDAPAAKDATAPKTSDVLRDGRGVWTHDQYRYGKKWNLVGGLVLRTLMDLVAIPSGMVAWDWLDWTVFSSVVASTVLLSLPTYPSPDVALQRMIQRSLGGADHFKIWTTYGDMAIWMGIWGGVASMFLYGMTADAPEFVEVSALAVEAFAIAQVYHLGIKALTGREGPKDAVTPGETTGEGRYYGPAAFSRLFPSGTPSGHVATMYAILSVVMHYFNTPAVWIGLNTFALLFSVTIIADNYHWASDVIIGAALGFCVGRWVVHHRSTKFRNDEGGLPRRVLATLANHAALAPMILPNGGVGAAVVFRF